MPRLCPIKRKFIPTENFQTLNPKKRVYFQLDSDINGADAEYDSFVEAFYLEEKYDEVIKEEYPGRKMTPLEVDIVIQIQGVNDSKLEYCSSF